MINKAWSHCKKSETARYNTSRDWNYLAFNKKNGIDSPLVIFETDMIIVFLDHGNTFRIMLKGATVVMKMFEDMYFNRQFLQIFPQYSYVFDLSHSDRK